MAKREEPVVPDFDAIDIDGFNPPAQNFELDPALITPLNVADWGSDDYARMFVRYRPRLQAYASRFLNDKTEVDEVVQDAFLYLFMSLPELDSEIAVLRYLKWKTRLLALDVLRARGRRPALLIEAEDVEAYAGSEQGPDAALNDVDDAAIVHMALARIPDRHREVLIRSEFEEASAREIGESLGISENAARQLMHRARRSFREQLAEVVGESDATISSFLSMAVRRAKEAGVKGAVMMLLIAIPAIGIGITYRHSASPFQAYLSATDNSGRNVDALINGNDGSSSGNTTPVVKPSNSPSASDQTDASPTPAPADQDPTADPAPPVELTAASMVSDTSVLAYGANPSPSASATGAPREFATFIVEGSSGIKAEVNIHQYDARLDVGTFLTITRGGVDYQFDADAINLTRTLSNDASRLTLTFTVKPDLRDYPEAVRKTLPKRLIIRLVVTRDLGYIQGAEILLPAKN